LVDETTLRTLALWILPWYLLTRKIAVANFSGQLAPLTATGRSLSPAKVQ
jgi:hypothetical protein